LHGKRRDISTIRAAQDCQGEAGPNMSAQPNPFVTGALGEAHPLRPISFGDPLVTIERKSDGTIYLRPKKALGEYPVRLTDRLCHWASAAPDRVCGFGPEAPADNVTRVRLNS